ncbi:MAG: SDR family NAD(P)-dependent oxidoreductase [Actinobacteria bacterium]|jgi:NAD(P)-dependent dehydrogenase (short-subunit alcohol dehydrogenase family)|nr:MAG: SDR family NAD(P)-dependent oxidoreductase [Actinomycetota bacterium]
MRDMQGKVVLVTGAASGLGRELAIALAHEKAVVLLVDIDEAGLMETSGMLDREGAESRSYIVDVSDRSQVGDTAATVREEFGGLDVLVNNAGVFAWTDIVDTTLEDWEWMMGVNLWGPILTINAFLPGMIERGCGHIVNIASLGGLVTMPAVGAYSTTKFGLVGLSETLQHELRPHGIAVTLVCPGNIRTPIIDHIKVRGYDCEKLTRMSYGVIPRMAAARAASIILKGIKRDRAMIILTPSAHLMYLIKRLSPDLYRVILGIPMQKVYERMR